MEVSLSRFLLPFPIRDCISLSRSDLEGLRIEAVRRNQLLLLYSQVKRRREMIEPASVADEFLEGQKAVYYRNAVRSIKQESAENRVLSLLSAEGVPAVLLRGNAIASDIYDDPYCRTSADSDILIRQEDLERSDSVLSKNGYVRGDSLPLKFWVNRIHHAQYRCPGTDYLLELHWNFGIPSFFRLSSGDIWTGVIQTEKDKYRLSPDMTIIHLLMHHYMHAFRELRILTDIIWALHKHEGSIDWSGLVQKLKGIGLLKTAMISVDQITSLCGEVAVRETALSKFNSAIGGIGGRGPGLLKAYFRPDPEKAYKFQDPRDKFMVRFALDQRRKILRSFVKTIFPMPEDLKQLYGDERNWMLPLHYSRFIAWRLKVREGMIPAPTSDKVG
jgi:hypothetical protein